jgi:hypothetical protein
MEKCDCCDQYITVFNLDPFNTKLCSKCYDIFMIINKRLKSNSRQFESGSFKCLKCKNEFVLNISYDMYCRFFNCETGLLQTSLLNSLREEHEFICGECSEIIRKEVNKNGVQK